MLAYFKVPLSWGEIFKRTIKETIDDDCPSLAAQLAYYFFLALFPALLFVIAVASFFPVSNLIDETIALLGRLAPPDVLAIVTDQITKISEGKNGGVLTFAFLFTIWSSSGAMVSIISTLNTCYDILEGRPWWKTRLTAILLTAGVAIFILVSIALVLVGPTFAEKVAVWMRLGRAFTWTWWVLQWPVIIALVVSAIALVYYFAPDAEQEFIWLTPGAALATGLWLITSLAFKFYIANFTNYNETYGAIGGVIVLMTWFYLTGLAILVGAEMNAEIEHASPYGKEPGEKVPGEKRKIGIAAEKAYEARLALGDTNPTRPIPEHVNCDLDEKLPARPAHNGLRPSDVLIGLIGALALTPSALAAGGRLKKELDQRNAVELAGDGSDAGIAD